MEVLHPQRAAERLAAAHHRDRDRRAHRVVQHLVGVGVRVRVRVRVSVRVRARVRVRMRVRVRVRVSWCPRG